MVRPVKRVGPRRKRAAPSPGAEGQTTSLAPGQVVEAEQGASEGEKPTMETATMEAQEAIPTVEENPPTVDTPEPGSEPTSEPEQPEEEPATEVTSPESPSTENSSQPVEQAQDQEFAGAILKNGSEIDAMTVMQCGRCGARFYAKDAAPDGSCPAVGNDDGLICGGTLGPVSL